MSWNNTCEMICTLIFSQAIDYFKLAICPVFQNLAVNKIIENKDKYEPAY